MQRYRWNLWCWLFVWVAGCGAAPVVTAQVYDPLEVDRAGVAVVDLVVEDAARDRAIPVRVYLPAEGEHAKKVQRAASELPGAGIKLPGVVMFSHGLGGSRENNPFLGEHWAGRGYVAVFMQHAGSDEDVWKDVPRLRRMAAMRRAANLRNAELRREDVSAVLDALARWNADAASPLAGRMDLSRVGMSGHSFGAVTAQRVSGQQPAWGRADWVEPRIKAAVLMSPSVPRGVDAEKVLDGVEVPWLMMTGTQDDGLIGGVDAAARRAVYEALPAGGKYEVVLDGAEHSAFGDRALPGDRELRNPNHHRVILALSTAFWDAYLRDDAAALAWLDGEGPREVMEPADRWQRK